MSHTRMPKVNENNFTGSNEESGRTLPSGVVNNFRSHFPYFSTYRSCWAFNAENPEQRRMKTKSAVFHFWFVGASIWQNLIATQIFISLWKSYYTRWCFVPRVKQLHLYALISSVDLFNVVDDTFCRLADIAAINKATPRYRRCHLNGT